MFLLFKKMLSSTQSEAVVPKRNIQYNVNIQQHFEGENAVFG